MSKFVVSLDFELFWGVSDSRTVPGYRQNIEGSLRAIPKMLELFAKYDIRVTWATVGMVMCRDFDHWASIRPGLMPGYVRSQCSNYSIPQVVREYPHLFFSRSTVERILATPGQEIGSHTYSHFYCGEEGATTEQFAADMECGKLIGDELGITYRSVVFPRNQVKKEYLPVLRNAGIAVFRGNPAHILYADGHVTPGGHAGRAVRFADSWVGLTGAHAATPAEQHGLVNVPASLFLRPYTSKLRALESLRIRRIKSAMNAAAASGGVFHLWWHPHNFGRDTGRNVAALETILQHYQRLRDSHGMKSMCMGDFAPAGAV